MNITKKEFQNIVKESVSKSEVCRKLGIHGNGTGLRKVKELSLLYNVDIGHFSHKAAINKFQRKYDLVKKICPVCGNNFEAQKGHSREKVTCSHSCSNTFFRSGEANPNYKDEKSEWGYRKICFSRWDKKCAICEFSCVVDVHHIDGNHDNNNIDNLIPLCPNHHKMAHMKLYENEVKKQIQSIITE
jgi:hypothetical protein